MFKRTIWLMAILCTGCVVTTPPEFPSEPVSISTAVPVKDGKKPLTPITAVTIGMPLSRVRQIMGEAVLTGYTYQKDTGSYRAVEVPAPYRQEQLKSGDTVYNVLFYFTHIQKEDGIIADDELTPLLFEGGVLKAKGWDAYFQHKMATK